MVVPTSMYHQSCMQRKRLNPRIKTLLLDNIRFATVQHVGNSLEGYQKTLKLATFLSVVLECTPDPLIGNGL